MAGHVHVTWRACCFSPAGGRVKGAVLTLAQACLRAAGEQIQASVDMVPELGYANHCFLWRIL